MAPAFVMPPAWIVPDEEIAFPLLITQCGRIKRTGDVRLSGISELKLCALFVAIGAKYVSTYRYRQYQNKMDAP